MLDRNLIIKAEKWAIWIALIAVLYLLRHLFPIFFLTFVLSYIGNTAVNVMTRRFKRRKVNVFIVYVILLALLIGGAFVVVPRVLAEARNLARQYIETESDADAAPQEGMVRREARELIDGVIVGVAGRQEFEDFRQSDAYAALVARVDAAVASATPRVVKEVTIFANHAFVLASQFVISIILSFLMLWDLPNTRARMRRFANGRTADVYSEIAPSLSAFSVTLGRAFEAQTVVAIVNAILSSIAFIALGLPSIALLATIVFFCSYIPIVGMILSTIPAALLALKVGGITHVLWLVVAIMVIHAVEAYMLNPLIYGRHLRLHPLAVLVILLIAEHIFGLWGLLLGVPVAAFLIKYVLEGGDPTRPTPKPAHTISLPPPSEV
ncbi:MAG TPA: AI-2E family transporter [Thermoanaerobaculia bacterium]